MKNVKEVIFRAKLSGHGIVQTDSDAQKQMVALEEGFRAVLTNDKDSTDNTFLKKFNNIGGFSKKNFYGKNNFKIKITPDCIKYNMRNGIGRMTAQVDKMGADISSIIMSEPFNLLFGWLVTRGSGEFSIKKNGSVALTAAEQTSDATPTMEVSLSNDMIKQGNTSLFYKEVVGDISYEIAHGSINLKELQFISCDEVTERLAFDEKNSEKFKTALNSKLPNFNSKIDYYRDIDSSMAKVIAERGILLKEEQIKYLVKYFLKALINFSIKKRESYAAVDSIEVAFISDPFDLVEWIPLKNGGEVEDIEFTPHLFYEEIPSDEMQNYGIYRGKYEELLNDVRTAQSSKKTKKAKTPKTTVDEGADYVENEQ